MRKCLVGICLLSVFFTNSSLAQKTKVAQKLDKFLKVKYGAGFAVLNNGDTIYGKFEFNDCPQNYKLLVHLDTLDYTKDAYNPNEVRYYALGKNIYVPHPSKDGLVFMRVLLEDSLRVYQHKHFYTSYTRTGFTNQFYCIKPTGEELVVSAGSDSPFVASTTKFFSDYPELCYLIKKKKYTQKDLYKIALIYNDWLRKRSLGGIDL